MNTTTVVRTNNELRAMHLSIYTLSKLARELNCVDPQTALEHRLTHQAFADKGWEGKLTLDSLGNFVSFA